MCLELPKSPLDFHLKAGRAARNLVFMNKSLLTCLAMLLTLVTFGLVSGCGKKEEKVDVSAHTQALKSADKDARVNACVELAKAGPKAVSAVPDLIPLLKDSDSEVRRLAAYAIMEIGPQAKAAISPIRELMNDRDFAVAQQALNTLRAIDPTAKDLQAPPNVTTGPKP